MSLYPDNAPRADRVRQLAADCAHLQQQIKQDVESMEKNDKDAVEVLNKIARDAGYKTLDEYIEEAERQLPDAERNALNDMKRQLEDLDTEMAIAHKVFRGMIAAGFICFGVRLFAVGYIETQSIIFGLRAVFKGILAAIRGAVQSAAEFLGFSKGALSIGSEASSITSEAADSLKFLDIGGTVLVAVGVVVDAVLLIAEAIEGANQRAELRDAINKCASYRFSIKQIQESATAIGRFHGEAVGFVDTLQQYKEWVDDGTITQAKADEAFKKTTQKLQDRMTKDINEVTTDKVWNDLREQDDQSKIAWTKEDPSLSYILDYLKSHGK